MSKLSLKQRLIVYFLFVAGITWCVSVFLAWNEGREQVDEFFDTYQLALARQLSTANWDEINQNTQKIANKVVDDLKNDGEEDDEALGFAVFNKNGKMVFNDNEKGRFFEYNADASGFLQQKIGKKQRKWRIVWIDSVDGKYRIAIGQELDYRNEVALEMVEEAIVPWGIGLLILLLMCIWFIYKEFKPLQKIASDFNCRSANDLSALKYQKVPKEVEPLIEAINGLFIKISKMIERERSFISDAAHELRSPLTALNVQLDVIELAHDDEETKQKALKNLREGLNRSSHLVEQMLDFSRIDAQIETISKKEFCIKEVLLKVIEEQKQYAMAKDIEIITKFNEVFELRIGQEFLWSLMMRNLLDNAIKYSKNGAKVIVEFYKDKIIFSNNKVEFCSEDVRNLGKRFFRPVGQKNNGSGLGLSIVEKIASLHDCLVSFDVCDDVFKVVISIKK